jgi:hypothetical protein
MPKKRLATTTLLTTILVLSIIAALLSDFASANPMEVGKVFEEQEFSPSAVDAKPPSITFQSPQENRTYASTVTLRCNITGGAYNKDAQPASITSLSYKGDWEKTGTAVQFKGTWGIDKLYVKGDLTYFSTNLTVPQGKHSITVWATELGGYQQDTGQKFQGSEVIKMYTFHLAASATVYFTVDCTAPTISLSMENKTYKTANVPLEFNVEETDLQFTYTLDGQPATAMTGNCSLTNLSNGYHNVTVHAVDQAGNVGTSETITFKVDAPFPTLQVTVGALVLSAVAIFLPIVYFKRRKPK